MLRAVILALYLTVAWSAHATPPGTAAGAPLPDFLTPDYAAAFTIAGGTFMLESQTQQGPLQRMQYMGADHVVTLTIARIACERPTCATVYANALNNIDAAVTQADGQFHHAGAADLDATWSTGLADNAAFVFRLPGAVLFWHYAARLPRQHDAAARFDLVRAAVERQRDRLAGVAGNVEFGRWEPVLRTWTERLLRHGHRAEAVAILRRLVAIAPADMTAQMSLAENALDQATVRAAARIVRETAEDPGLIVQADRLLGEAEPALASVPVLASPGTGLHVVLIPLPPCDLRLVAAAATIYRRITDVPVRFARFGTPWQWGRFDRIPDQKAIRRAIVEQQGPTVDFTGWTLTRYQQALLDLVKGKNALARFRMQAYVARLPTRSGQYLADRDLDRFGALLPADHARHRRTMYVGVTAANLYSGDANFVFSLHQAANGAILSYHMMTAAASGQPYQSRQRLAERLAKEMVLASLGQLKIPRAADPTDPYSYADGVPRLDQKTLVLSAPTKAALDRFR